jgi:hypothetical protein
MRKAALLLSILLVGCQGGSGSVVNKVKAAPVQGELAEGNGRWQSRQKLILTEWTFHKDGSYDALHQEGSLAPQIRGKFRWDNGFLVIDPDPGSIEVRGRDAEEANRLQDRLSKGYELTVTWDAKDKFTAKPKGGGEAMVFTKM